MIKKLLNNVMAQKQADRQADLYRNLIRHEAKIGGTVFGPVPAGVRREFFCLDKHTWVWHEEWFDQNGQHQSKTTRYDVRPSGILKAQGDKYMAVGPEEAVRLRDAAELYYDKIQKELYSFVV